MYKSYFLLFFLLLPHKLSAIPAAIAQIVRLFEGQSRKKVVKRKSPKDSNPKDSDPKDSNSKDSDPKNSDAKSSAPAPLSNVQEAQIAIDQAIKNSKLSAHPATWYYRAVIYDRLLRDHIASQESDAFLNEALAAYEQTKKVGFPNSQFYSFAVDNLNALWNYFLKRGMGYYRQEVFDQALNQLAICRRILPQEPTPLLYTAIVYHTQDQPEEAIRAYESYVDAKGPDCAVFRAMAHIYYNKFKNFDKAIAVINQGLITFPFNNELLEEECLIYKDAGKVDDYATALRLQYENKDLKASYAYGYLLEYQDATQEAIDCYQAVLKANPNQYDTLRQIGLIFYNQAIKLYAETLNLVGDRQPLSESTPAELCGLTHVMVSYTKNDFAQSDKQPIGLPSLELKSLMTQRAFFSVKPRVMVYAHPLVKTHIRYFAHLLELGHIPYTSPMYGYLSQKNSAIRASNTWREAIFLLEQYLKQCLYYLKLARRQNKKDKPVSQALYYSYYHLKKYASAYRLLGNMKKYKQYLEDDPFLYCKPNV